MLKKQMFIITHLLLMRKTVLQLNILVEIMLFSGFVDKYKPKTAFI